jgi:hypothetical protein
MPVYPLYMAFSNLYASSIYFIQRKKKERRKKGWKEINTKYQWKFDHKCQNIVVVLKEFFTVKMCLN